MKNVWTLLLLLVAYPVLSDVIKEQCEKIETSQQVAKCARYKQYQSANHLNVAYKAALDRIKHQYAKAPLLAEEYIALLEGAQREWVRSRDADCKLEAFEIEESAEAYRVTIDNCSSRMSAGRAGYLDSIAPDI